MFSGIPFGRNNPYNYLEAKRVLRLAMDELRRRSDLKNELGMDPAASGRSAITGRESTRIWDFLRLRQSQNATSFTEFPHLTLSIQQEQLFALVTVPHAFVENFGRASFRVECRAFAIYLLAYSRTSINRSGTSRVLRHGWRSFSGDTLRREPNRSPMPPAPFCSNPYGIEIKLPSLGHP